MPNLVYGPHHEGHRERLRERFNRASADGLHDYEVLELLLTYSISRKDVKPIAKELMGRFGGLSGVFDATPLELRQVPDIGPAAATLIKLVKEISGLYLRDRLAARDLLTSPERVADFARMKLAGLPHEAFMVIYTNVQNEILGHDILHEGTIDQVAVYPRRIIENALVNRAAGLILVHNHPSGYTDPSEEDKKLTQAILQTGRVLNIRVLDHIVVGKRGHYSFLEHGLIPEQAG